MKKRIWKSWKITTLISWCVYLVIWLGKCFVHWMYIHPFQWIIDIPTSDVSYRENMLGCMFLWTLLKWVFVAVIYDVIKKEKSN